jgi:membrane protein required for beta-lactamase induction
MFLPALQGWFTIIFWFVASALVAGIPAALLLVLLYRSAERRLVLNPPTSSGDAHQQHWLRQMCWLLEWPAARLMIGLIAIAGDFDLVQAAWREHGDEQDQGKLQHRLLLAIAGRQLDQSVHSSSVGNVPAAVAIASAGHALLQRMLMLLSSLLLALAILAWVL